MTFCLCSTNYICKFHKRGGYVTSKDDKIMNSFNSYSHIFALGTRPVKDLLSYPHYVGEKVDGSQISFGIFEDVDLNTHNLMDDYQLRVRSKGAEMVVDAPQKMFAQGVTHIKSIQHLLHPGWTYRGEYLQKPKHNTLAYDRIPNGHIILFDINAEDGGLLAPTELANEAARIGLECVPVLRVDEGGNQTTLEHLRYIIDNTSSVLGGQLVEGIVVKPLVELYGIDKKILMGKFVSERFKEAHVHAWKESNPTSGDILDNLAKTFTTEARWMKSIQHMKEAGTLFDAPQDIGPLIHEIVKDVGMEEKEAIQQMLWKWAWPHLQRRVTGGFPSFYKDYLLKQQFEGNEHVETTTEL